MEAVRAPIGAGISWGHPEEGEGGHGPLVGVLALDGGRAPVLMQEEGGPMGFPALDGDVGPHLHASARAQHRPRTRVGDFCAGKGQRMGHPWGHPGHRGIPGGTSLSPSPVTNSSTGSLSADIFLSLSSYWHRYVPMCLHSMASKTNSAVFCSPVLYRC